MNIAKICYKDVANIVKNSKSTFWIGAKSFEDRCYSSIKCLKSTETLLEKTIFIDYISPFSLNRQIKRKREKNYKIMREYAKSISYELQEVSLNPYSFYDLNTVLNNIINSCKIDCFIFDVTCLTKIHALALASWIILDAPQVDWILTYTRPEDYGNLSALSGWRDIIVAPFADKSILKNEAKSRGIIIPGHESNRLIMSMSELEPLAGKIIIVVSKEKPEYAKVCENKNSYLMTMLTKSKIYNWNKEYIKDFDMIKIANIIQHEIDEARNHEAPVILFPFGPKPVIIMASLQICSTYPKSAWFVYPIPIEYDLDYSYGQESPFWFAPFHKQISK